MGGSTLLGWGSAPSGVAWPRRASRAFCIAGEAGRAGATVGGPLGSVGSGVPLDGRVSTGGEAGVSIPGIGQVWMRLSDRVLAGGGEAGLAISARCRMKVRAPMMRW